MLACLEKPIQRYLTALYGAPPDPVRQYRFYRCELCRGVVTWRQIQEGGCRCGTGSRVRAAHLSFSEKVRLLLGLAW